MNALFQLHTEIDLQNIKFPIKQRFVWSRDNLTVDSLLQRMRDQYQPDLATSLEFL